MFAFQIGVSVHGLTWPVPARNQHGSTVPHHLHLVHLSFLHHGEIMTTAVARPTNGLSSSTFDNATIPISKAVPNGHQPNGDAKELSSERAQIIDDEKRFT